MISFVASAWASCCGSGGAPSSPGLPDTRARGSAPPPRGASTPISSVTVKPAQQVAAGVVRDGQAWSVTW